MTSQPVDPAVRRRRELRERVQVADGTRWDVVLAETLSRFIPLRERLRLLSVCRLWLQLVPTASFLASEKPKTIPAGFRKLGVLGNGTFGTVLLLRHKQTGFRYAGKVLKKRETMRMRRLEHVYWEVTTMRRAHSHPFVARLVDVIQDPAEITLVQELAAGGDLFESLNRRTQHCLGEELARFYFSQLALVLEHLHLTCMILFRDIRPENILVAHNGYLRICDFGNAKIIPSNQRAHTLCGAPEYTSPEMIQGSHSFPADWWSLGVLLYEMLYGTSPFASQDPMGIFANILAANQSLQIPNTAGADAVAVVRSLLTVDEAKRTGAGKIWGLNWCEDVDPAVVLQQSQPLPSRAFFPDPESPIELNDRSTAQVPAQPLKKEHARRLWADWCGDL